MVKFYCKFGKKAQIIFVELIFVLIALFIAFGVFFPGFVYKNRWREAIIFLSSRDLILTIDRMGKLYNYSFDQKALGDFLENVTEKIFIPWSEIEGTLPNVIIIACNCTEEEINRMNYQFNPLMMNRRRVYLVFHRSNLEEIPAEADVLLIKGYRNLSGYSQRFRNYIARGTGIVEMMDFDAQAKVNNDDTQREVFGLLHDGFEPGNATHMIFSKPAKAADIVYFPYKYFYHVPIPLNASSYEAVQNCSFQPSAKGSFVLATKAYQFWICNESSVWFDTDANGTRDTLVGLGRTFKINQFNFTLSYIHGNSSIAVSFKPNYTFPDYLSYEQGGNRYIPKIRPGDNDERRILVKAIKGNENFPAVILNSSRVAWMYDFGNNPSDEEENLLLSLLLWASRKKSIVLASQIKTGFSTSYINVQNLDIFEVYKFSLGLARPY